MKVQIIKATVADGKNHQAGSTPDLSDKDARFLIALGKAVECTESKPEKGKRGRAPIDRAIDAEEIETR